MPLWILILWFANSEYNFAVPEVMNIIDVNSIIEAIPTFEYTFRKRNGVTTGRTQSRGSYYLLCLLPSGFSTTVGPLLSSHIMNLPTIFISGSMDLNTLLQLRRDSLQCKHHVGILCLSCILYLVTKACSQRRKKYIVIG